MLIHKGTISISTERLLLRKFRIEDAPQMFTNWASDKEVSNFMRWSKHKTIEETKKSINRRVESYIDNSYYVWAIILKQTEEAIGSIGLFIESEEDLCGKVAYCIGKNYWGQGIATESLKAILEFAFNEVGFNRIEAYCSVNNVGSGQVMKKAGMTFEGIAKQKYKSAFGFEDSNMYGIVKDDYMQLTNLEL